MKAILIIILIALLGWLVYWYVNRDSTINNPDTTSNLPVVETVDSSSTASSTDDIGPYEDKG